MKKNSKRTKLIFANVETGTCTIIKEPDGTNTFIDLGYGDDFYPSEYISHNETWPGLVILSDLNPVVLPEFELWDEFLGYFGVMYNVNLDTDWIEQKLKQLSGVTEDNQLYTGVRLVNFLRNPEVEAGYTPLQQEAEVNYLTYFNSPVKFDDLDNLSLAVFVITRENVILIAGSMRPEGWFALMENPDVVELLEHTNIFMAPLKGRPEGFCLELFDHLSPDLIIVPDYGLPEGESHRDVYSNFAKGTKYKDRYVRVLSTAREGLIELELA